MRYLLAFFLFWTSIPAKAQLFPQINNSGTWQTIDSGLTYAVFDADIKATVNDGKIHILRINPNLYDLEFGLSSELKSGPLPLDTWCDTLGLIAGVNGPMFSLANMKTANGYLRQRAHFNNSRMKGGYSAMFAFNPKKGHKVPEAKIIDLYLDKWENWKNSYHCYAQSIRMIDDSTHHVEWKKNPGLRSSMTVLAIDKSGNVLFIFCRSPYSANEMSQMLLRMPLDIHSAMYLDGGPEASFYIHHNNTQVALFGCFVTNTFERDDNDHFWNIPNIIGIRKK